MKVKIFNMMELYVTKCIKQNLADKGATVLKDWLVQKNPYNLEELWKLNYIELHLILLKMLKDLYTSLSGTLKQLFIQTEAT